MKNLEENQTYKDFYQKVAYKKGNKYYMNWYSENEVTGEKKVIPVKLTTNLANMLDGK